jgi:hypothetical protein
LLNTSSIKTETDYACRRWKRNPTALTESTLWKPSLRLKVR